MIAHQRREQVLRFIGGYIASNKVSPTIAEIGAYVGMSSPAGVHKLLVALEGLGFIKRTPHISRGIEIVKQV